MSTEIEIQKADGTAINIINLGKLTPGTITNIEQLRIKNISDVAFDDLRLTAILGNRSFVSAGSNSQGQEAVTEKWVEASISSGAYKAIGGNPTVTANYTAIAKPDVSASVTLDTRINIPAGASTFGDYFLSLELFYKVE